MDCPLRMSAVEIRNHNRSNNNKIIRWFTTITKMFIVATQVLTSSILLFRSTEMKGRRVLIAAKKFGFPSNVGTLSRIRVQTSAPRQKKKETCHDAQLDEEQIKAG